MKYRLERFFLNLLRLVFNFDKWHVNNNKYNRLYKLIIAEKISKLDLDVVVEIGCGMGDVISSIKAREKVGYDITKNIIKAASIRYFFNSVNFKVGEINDVEEKNIGALIMVNWIHNIEQNELRSMIINIINNITYLVVDVIDNKYQKNYKYIHNFKFLKEKACLVSSFRVLNEPRQFQIWKIN